MSKSDNQIVFPYYICRSVYFIDRYFIVKKPGKLFRELRAVKTRTGGIAESDLRPFLKNHNFKETPEKYWLGTFFNNMLSLYTIGRICEALQNPDRYADLDYPENFKLLKGRFDYLGTRQAGYELLL